jgi:hypothetical protein
MLGILLFCNLTVRFDETPARPAIKELGKVLGINIVGRYNDDPTGHGLEPNAPITFEAESMPALDVLEAVLDQCTLGEDCTWQLRNSFVEVGTKRRLAVRGARELRTYPIRDLLLEAPYFAGPGLGGVLSGGGFVDRKRPDDIAIELLDLIVDTVEPEAWEPAPVEEPQEDPTPIVRPGGPGDGGKTASPLPAAGGADPDAAKFRRHGQWATVRYWRGTLIVNAPGFVHRQLGGSPEPIRPGGGDGKQR